jgi:hypothetical protein
MYLNVFGKNAQNVFLKYNVARGSLQKEKCINLLTWINKGWMYKMCYKTFTNHSSWLTIISFVKEG